jgi:hypothetical protein
MRDMGKKRGGRIVRRTERRTMRKPLKVLEDIAFYSLSLLTIFIAGVATGIVITAVKDTMGW